MARIQNLRPPINSFVFKRDCRKSPNGLFLIKSRVIKTTTYQHKMYSKITFLGFFDSLRCIITGYPIESRGLVANLKDIEPADFPQKLTP